MDFDDISNDIKKYKIPLLTAVSAVFLVTVIITLFSGGSRHGRSIPITDNKVRKQRIIGKSSISTDFRDAGSFKSINKFYMRRQGANSYFLKKRNYELKEADLYSFNRNKTSGFTNRMASTNKQLFREGSPYKKEIEIIFRKRKKKKLRKKEYK